jgi:hypothetical protein
MVDTENGSGSLYAHLYEYEVAELEPPYTPERYVDLIKAAEQEFDVLIIDSITHEWSGKGGCLEIHDTMPGNSFTNWAKVNPRHDAFMQAILQAKCHIVATMRSKETYVLQENEKGKQEPKKVGMEAQQRQGVIYEFTTILTMDITNQATPNKDRTGLFSKGQWFVPSEQTGEQLKSWLESGVEPPEPPKADSKQVQRIQVLCRELGITEREDRLSRINQFLQPRYHRTVQSTKDLTPDEADAVIKAMDERVRQKQQESQQEAANACNT